MTRAVTAGEFKRGRDVHLLVAPSARQSLELPLVLNMPVADVLIQRPQGMPLQGSSFVTSIDVPEMTIARVSEATCLPGGVLLVEPGIVLEESFSATWECTHHHHLLLADGTYSLKGAYGEVERLPGRFICLDYQHYTHYGHFLVDVMSRVWAADYLEAVLGIDDVRILVRGSPVVFADSLLDLFGIPAGRLVPLAGPVQVDELFVATKSYQIQEYTSSLATATWKRISNAARGQGGPERIYISRSRNGQRSLLNEADVEDLVSARGFVVIHPQDLPIPDQVGLFANAELVVGTSGSNMFNLAFQRRLRAALILVSPVLVHHTDVFFRYGHRSELAYFVGDRATDHPGFQQMNVHSGWKVELDAFAEAFDQWLDHNT